MLINNNPSSQELVVPSVGRQEGHTDWWGVGVVIYLERDADLHIAQLMPLPLTVSCSSKIQIGFTFLVLAHLGSPGRRAVKRMCVCVCASQELVGGHSKEALLLQTDPATIFNFKIARQCNKVKV